MTDPSASGAGRAKFVPAMSKSEAPVIEPFKADLKKKRYFKNEYMFAGTSAPRVIVCGSSGSGKTTAVLCTVLKGYLGKIDKIVVCAKSAHQGAYDSIKELAAQCPGQAILLDNLDDLVMDAKMFNPEERNILIMDDWAADKRAEGKTVQDIFYTARHYNCTVFYLTQSFFRGTPAQLRNNASAFMLFRCTQGYMETRKMAEYLAEGISIPMFIEAYETAISDPYGFLLVDKMQTDPRLRHRRGFTDALAL